MDPSTINPEILAMLTALQNGSGGQQPWPPTGPVDPNWPPTGPVDPSWPPSGGASDQQASLGNEPQMPLNMYGAMMGSAPGQDSSPDFSGLGQSRLSEINRYMR